MSVTLSRRTLLGLFALGIVDAGIDGVVQRAFAEEARAVLKAPGTYDKDLFSFFDEVRPDLEGVFGKNVYPLDPDQVKHLQYNVGDLFVIGGTGTSLGVEEVTKLRFAVELPGKRVQEFDPDDPKAKPVFGTPFPIRPDTRSLLYIDKVAMGDSDRYVVSSAAGYVGPGSQMYKYATSSGVRRDLRSCLRSVKEWQDAYDAISKEGKLVFFGDTDIRSKKYHPVAERLGMADASSLSREDTLRLALHIIVDIYKQGFMRLADQSNWPNVRLRPESRETLRGLATTYTTNDVEHAMSGISAH